MTKWDRLVARQLFRIECALKQQGIRTMAAIDDLNAAVQLMQVAVSDAVADIQKLTAAIAAAPSDATAVSAAAVQIHTLASNLEAAVNPAPAPAPAPAPTA